MEQDFVFELRRDGRLLGEAASEVREIALAVATEQALHASLRGPVDIYEVRRTKVQHVPATIAVTPRRRLLSFRPNRG